MRRSIAPCALAVVLAGCAESPVRVFGQDVATMTQPVIETAQLSLTGPSPNRAPSPRPPQTYFFGGASPDPQANYFLYEASKAPIETASRVIPSDGIRQWLRGVVQRLLDAAPDGAPEIQVHVLAHPSYQALARENGDVYISINALARAASEDEVAVLLGHEIAHVLLNHHEKERLFNEQREATSAAVGAGAIAAWMAATASSGTLLRGGGLGARESEELGDQMLVIAATKLAVDFVGNDIVNASWNRAQESEADHLGLDLTTRAGYDPYKLYDTFGNFIADQAGRQSQLDMLNGKAELRAAQVNREMSTALESGRLDLDPLIEGVKGGLGDLFSAAATDARSFVSARYLDPEARMAESALYVEKFYPDADQAAATDYEAVKRRLGIGALNNAYVLVDEALAQVTNEDFGTAIETLGRAYSTARISSHPLPRLVEAMARQGRGDHRGALNALRAVDRSTPQSIQAHLMIAELEAQVGSRDRALAQLDEAQREYGVAPVQPMRITLLAGMGRRDEALAALERCRLLDDAGARRSCERAADAAGLLERREVAGIGAAPALPGLPSLPALPVMPSLSNILSGLRTP